MAKKDAPKFVTQPYVWVQIPAGQVTLVPSEYGHQHSYLKADTTFTLQPFEISKYPVTNAQYRFFVHERGYSERRWWTDEGWQAKCDGWAFHKGWIKTGKAWMQPCFWDEMVWNRPQYPVVGVSWYEAIAFCQWMSAKTGETITLPTEQEWQRAAQGDDGRAYPWGDEFHRGRCNTEHSEMEGTLPVNHYEGRGDSPFGVVDMSGNVWKWCLTAYKSGDTDLSGSDSRIIRGGSWADNRHDARVTNRGVLTPYIRNNNIGFFVVRHR